MALFDRIDRVIGTETKQREKGRGYTKMGDGRNYPKAWHDRDWSMTRSIANLPAVDGTSFRGPAKTMFAQHFLPIRNNLTAMMLGDKKARGKPFDDRPRPTKSKARRRSISIADDEAHMGSGHSVAIDEHERVDGFFVQGGGPLIKSLQDRANQFIRRLR